MILGAFRFTILGWQQQQMIPLRWNWICGKFRSDAGHSVRLVDTPDSFRYHSFFEQAYWRTFTPVKRSNNSIGLWNQISLFFSAIVKSTVTALNSDNPFFSLAISIKKIFSGVSKSLLLLRPFWHFSIQKFFAVSSKLPEVDQKDGKINISISIIFQSRYVNFLVLRFKKQKFS